MVSFENKLEDQRSFIGSLVNTSPLIAFIGVTTTNLTIVGSENSQQRPSVVGFGMKCGCIFFVCVSGVKNANGKRFVL